jgi:hypothetical protein
MTIAVMFGNLSELHLHGCRCFIGDNDDQLWVIEDVGYNRNVDPPDNFPILAENTPLPVILHKSSRHHSSQLGWVETRLNGKPYISSYFSHNEPIAEKIKQWVVHCPPNDVSNIVFNYNNIVCLTLLDNLAAWNLLAKVDTCYLSTLDSYVNLVSTFAPDLKLSRPGVLDGKDFYKKLGEKAAQFC